MMHASLYDFARKFDHTMLRPDAGEAAIRQTAREAIENSFMTVCVAPSWVSLAASLTSGSNVGVTAVIGFPHGNTTGGQKCIEAAQAIENGASEIDVVVNLGLLKSDTPWRAAGELSAVVALAKSLRNDTLCKVIIESGALNVDQVDTACDICADAGADFVKTSTGFYYQRTEDGSYAARGATIDAVSRIRQRVGSRLGIKASGGIGDLQKCVAMLDAGATRIGASATVQIIREYQGLLKGMRAA